MRAVRRELDQLRQEVTRARAENEALQRKLREATMEEDSPRNSTPVPAKVPKSSYPGIQASGTVPARWLSGPSQDHKPRLVQFRFASRTPLVRTDIADQEVIPEMLEGLLEATAGEIAVEEEREKEKDGEGDGEEEGEEDCRSSWDRYDEEIDFSEASTSP